MIDVVDADQIVAPPDRESARRQRDMTAYWAAHGDEVAFPGNSHNDNYDEVGNGDYEDVGDDFEGAIAGDDD